MTIYSDKEISGHDAEPIECYEFVGTFKTYRYTSSDLAVTVGGNIYNPLPIKRSSLKAGVHDEDNIQITVEMPVTSGLATDYGFQITPPRLHLNIYRIHRGTDFANDYAKIWSGPVSKVTIHDNLFKVVIPSIFGNAMEGNIPSVFYQTPCNHVLFDSACKISRAANSVVTNVTLVEESTIQIDSVGGWVDGSFVGGEIADVEHNDRRMIVTHASNLITVNYPFSNLLAGTQVEVTRGCDHAYNGDCKNKYDNQINFGGFPFIPSINPFESGI